MPRKKNQAKRDRAKAQRSNNRARGFAANVTESSAAAEGLAVGEPVEEDEPELVQPDITGWFDEPESDDDGEDELPNPAVDPNALESLMTRCGAFVKKKKKTMADDDSYEARRKHQWRQNDAARKRAVAAKGMRKITTWAIPKLKPSAQDAMPKSMPKMFAEPNEPSMAELAESEVSSSCTDTDEEDAAGPSNFIDPEKCSKILDSLETE
jgi:hypothetical protein